MLNKTLKWQIKTISIDPKSLKDEMKNFTNSTQILKILNIYNLNENFQICIYSQYAYNNNQDYRDISIFILIFPNLSLKSTIFNINYSNKYFY